MRVLQINKFFFEKGGAERYFFSLCGALQERGHEVMHFSMQHPDNLPSPYAPYFVKRRDYYEATSLPSRVSRGFSIVRSPEAYRNLSRLIADHRPDVAHLHNIYHQLTPSVIDALARARVPVVLTPHDYKLVCPKYSLYDGKQFCYRCQGGKFYQAALTRCQDGSLARSALLAFEAYWQRLRGAYDAVRFMLAPSRFMRDTLVEASYGADRVLYLRSFVTEAEVSEDASFATSKFAGRLPAKYVLYFGRLSEEKGLGTLLGAVAALPDVRVVVCGDGPLRSDLERDARKQGIAGRVLFLGFVAKPALNSIVRGASAVVVPSEWPENAPFTAIEAMALGVPIVVSRMGGLPELAEMGGGLQFEAGNVEELASCIDVLWTDDGRVGEIGARSCKAVADNFDRDAHLDALEQIYERALGGATRQ